MPALAAAAPATNSWRNAACTPRAVAPTGSAVDRDLAPAEDAQALLGGDPLDHGRRLRGLLVVGGRKAMPTA